MKGEVIGLLIFLVMLIVLATMRTAQEMPVAMFSIGALFGAAVGFMVAHYMHRLPKLRAARKGAETRRRNKANGRSVKNG